MLLRPPPLVARLLVEAQLPVHPLDVVVRLLPLAFRLPQERQRLLQLPLPQPCKRLPQFRHPLVRRVAPQTRPPPARHLQALLRSPRLVDVLAELPQRPQLGQVAEHPPQVGPFPFAQVLRPLDDQVAALEHERRLFLVRRALAAGPLPRPLLRPAPLALTSGLAAPLAGAPQPAHGVQHFLGHVLQDVEDAKLVRRVRPGLRQHRRIEVGAVGDDRPGQQPVALQHQQEPPHVVLVVGRHQGEADDLVGQRVGGQQQGAPAQVRLVHAQRAAEPLQDALAMRGQVDAAQLLVEAVVEEAEGEIQEEVAPHGGDGPLGVEPVLQQAVEDGLADAVVVVGPGRVALGPGAEGSRAAAEGGVLGVADLGEGFLPVGEGADNTDEEALAASSGAAAGAGMGLGGASDDADVRHGHGLRSWEARG